MVGHSFGGRVVIKLASEGLCDRAVLIDSAGLKPKLSVKHILRRAKHKLYKLMKWSSNNLGSPDYRQLSPIMKKTFVNIVNYYQEEEARKITIPTLIIWGDKDKDTPRYMAKRLSVLINDSAVIILKGGHYSYLDDYCRYIAILREFC